jgi:primosomal protein N'
MSSSILVEILKEIFAAWREGGPRIRLTIVVSFCLLAIGGLLASISQFAFRYPFNLIGKNAGGVVAVFGALLALVIYGLQKSKDEANEEKKIEAVEKRVQDNPKEPQLAWELAQAKLERYLNRNLSQVNSIFLLTVVVMACGFTLIGIGAFQGFKDPEHFKASILSSISGVIVSFIGGTFLILYKSTMAQAKDYVNILERINAVGMSVKILDGLSEENQILKNQTIAEIAKQLLHMYSLEMSDSSASRKKQKSSESTQ